MSFLLEGHFNAMSPIVLVGESGSGKSWIYEHALTRYLKKYND
jgi:ABC-type dipeptide/oligopeptide/nickel transport system ATPase component